MSEKEVLNREYLLSALIALFLIQTFLPPNPIDMTGIKKFVFELKGNWCVNRLKREWKWKKFFIFLYIHFSSVLSGWGKKDWGKNIKRLKNFQEYWPWYGKFILLSFFYLRRVGRKAWGRKKLMKTWSHAVRWISSWKLYKHGQSVCGGMKNWHGLR